MSSNFIGGFFELEESKSYYTYHKKAYALSNGRACFNLILQNAKPTKIYVPFYCCDTLLEPIKMNNINYEFYSINEQFEPEQFPEILETELVLYINYFGLKNNFIKKVVNYYKDLVVIDDTQNYFNCGYKFGWSFNSSRKFFGVPDGAFLYSPYPIKIPLTCNTNFITDHLVLRLDERIAEAYLLFQQNELLQKCEPYHISKFSEKILDTVNYEMVAKIRIRNFEYYNKCLKKFNALKQLDNYPEEVPFCYPLLLKKPFNLSRFFEKNIYIPKLWEDVIRRDNNNFETEKKISNNLLPLPIDHRYSEEDLSLVVHMINNYLN